MRVSFYLLTFLFTYIGSFAQKQKTISNNSSYDQYITASMPQWKIPGLSVVVVKDGKVVFMKGYGVAELGKPQAFTSTTASISASTTKAMTAVCMAMLIDEGKAKWDDKVSEVYPQLKLKDAYASSEITIKDLFTHNTGLGNADLLWTERYNTDEIIYRMRNIAPAYSLRSSFIYQNLMYIVAGEVIRKLSGKSWEDFITERLFQPLGMLHTYALPSRMKNDVQRITPHFLYADSVVRPISYPAYDIGAPGGVWSSAEDISKWMLFMLDSCRINGKALLKPETYAELFTPQAVGGAYPTATVVHPHWNTYGLGWFQEDYRGNMLQYHTGSLPGAVAIIGLIPDQHFGIYVFGNLDHAELRHAMMYKAIDLWCFNDNSRDWSKELFALYSDLNKKAKKKKDELEKKRIGNTHTSFGLSNYAGEYENKLYGTAKISLVNDSLVLKLEGDVWYTLSHWHYDVFAANSHYDWEDKSWVQFSIAADGKVSQFEIDGILYKKIVEPIKE